MPYVVCKTNRGTTLHLRTTGQFKDFSLCNLVVTNGDVVPEPDWEYAKRVCPQCLEIAQFFAMAQEVT